jgi:hypothetical protein
LGRKKSKKRIKREPGSFLYDRRAIETVSRAFGGLLGFVVLFEDTEPDSQKKTMNS